MPGLPVSILRSFFKKKINPEIDKPLFFGRKFPLLLLFKIYAHTVKNYLGNFL